MNTLWGNDTEHRFAAPPGVGEAAGTDPRAVLLAAHVRVLRALTGDAGVADDTLVHTLQLPGCTGPQETVLDFTGGGDLAAHQALLVSYVDGQVTVRSRAMGAGRIAGYYRTALCQAIADPAGKDRPSLLSAEEIRYQVHGLAGPRKDIPDLRAHELFERRVRERPGAVAAEHQGMRWTYAELNARANRVAHALLESGLRAEDVVAVVTDRDLDWLAAVLGVFKAGGAYLPVEPGFPAERVTAMLRRSGCRFVLAGRGGAGVPAGDRIVLSIQDTYHRGHDGNPAVRIRSGQVAYLFFTSGSSGEPKGAMCEHKGMLNHLLAKIEDCGIGPDSVIAQVAPQCFDISLWQLVAALLVGGRVLIVEQEAVLDVPRFLDMIEAARVEVLQVVPSYLEVLLSQVDQRPRELPHLRCVSATGEALKRDLVLRWFARYPRIALLNAYGLTETCDDTNHELMTAAPARDRVPIGRPIRNAYVYVVDERLRPVPLGAPGEIVFSGVCVGRGYVNDEHRSRLAFVSDPLRPGQRLYRSGDVGRWLPDGRLEFLGRRDNQVKVHGFRIEIDEIETRLSGMDGVRDCAVVVVPSSGGERFLVAFYSAAAEISAETLRAELAARLPGYMVPGHYRRLAALPLTGNGKVDRKALALIAGEAEEPPGEPPGTSTERRIAALWARVLGIEPDRVGRQDNFFERGGTSLSAVRLLAGLDRRLSLRELTGNPVLADFARVLDGRAVPPASVGSEGLEWELAPGRPAIARVTGSPDGWLAEHRDRLRTGIAEHGAVLVRGLGLADATGVALAAKLLGSELMAEREAFAARKEYQRGLYSSLKWPADQPMCMHNELSYATRFPGLLLIACLRPAAAGGITGLADSRDLLAVLPPSLVDRFERDGWQLRRSYDGTVGVPWQDAFGRADPDGVVEYCADNAIEHEWGADGILRTRQRRPAVVRHPRTGEPCWFNQIAFLNQSTLDPDVRDYLLLQYGEEGLPFNSFHGDGEPVRAAEVDTINDAYQEVTVREPGQAGDLLLVDNIRMAHSREPFEGAREVIVAMADPVDLADLAGTPLVAVGGARR